MTSGIKRLTGPRRTPTFGHTQMRTSSTGILERHFVPKDDQTMTVDALRHWILEAFSSGDASRIAEALVSACRMKGLPVPADLSLGADMSFETLVEVMEMLGLELRTIKLN